MSRQLLGMSQEGLGQALGRSFQQIHKYESGATPVTAARLFRIAEILGPPVAFFFEDPPSERPSRASTRRSATADMTDDAEFQLAARRETLELVRAYYRISDPLVRKRVLALVKAAGGPGRQRGSPKP